MVNYFKMFMSLKYGWGMLVVYFERFIEKFFFLKNIFKFLFYVIF